MQDMHAAVVFVDVGDMLVVFGGVFLVLYPRVAHRVTDSMDRKRGVWRCVVFEASTFIGI
jgi:hypothetical protein